MKLGILLPWEISGDMRYIKRILNSTGYYVVRHTAGQWWRWPTIYADQEAMVHSTCKEAMDATDDDLRTAGNTLLTEEQWEKIRVLI